MVPGLAAGGQRTVFVATLWGRERLERGAEDGIAGTYAVVTVAVVRTVSVVVTTTTSVWGIVFVEVMVVVG